MDYDEYVKYARPGDRLCISDEELATMDAEAYRISQAKRDEPVSPIVAATAPEPAASQGVPERKTKRLTLAQMIAAGRYDGYVNQGITEKNFPVKPESTGRRTPRSSVSIPSSPPVPPG